MMYVKKFNKNSRQCVGYVDGNWSWFSDDPVYVLVQTLEQVPEELLSVLLTVTHETRCKSLYLRLERRGVDDALAAALPQLLDDFGKRLD